LGPPLWGIGLGMSSLPSLANNVLTSISPQQAESVLAAVSIGLGAAAVAAPRAVGRFFGVDPARNDALPLLVRFIGVRNVTLGTALLQAADDTESARRALTTGLWVGAADTAVITLAAARKTLAPRAAAVALLVLAGIAGLGYAALQD